MTSGLEDGVEQDQGSAHSRATRENEGEPTGDNVMALHFGDV